MKKRVIVPLIVLFALSMAFAVYEGQNARGNKIKAEKIKISLNEKIRLLEDSLRYMSIRHEIERRNAVHFERAANSRKDKKGKDGHSRM
ncbi:hypothetical protein JMN32_05245 [Fulvivirga sp. 29W222]|uniref:Uncharacterized protein n=1 Tax=Fulvivirga marina TaxID=2494733 RepID=A0A937FWC5_9BACT|nr:hypothetical protein [Fulvivirga marina]MBL6445703.1 hypothetical protein [Fulvivirga marina]